MGNTSSSSGVRRQGSRRDNPPPTPPQPPQLQQQEISANRYVFAAATPYPNPNAPPLPPPPPTPQQYYHQYPNYYHPPPPTMPVPLPGPYGTHHRYHHGGWGGRGYPYGAMQPPPMPPMPFVEHQKAVTIRNDVNLKKETLRLEADEENPGKFLISFTFDATVAGSITLFFFAKEGEDCTLTPMREDLLPPLTVNFEQGLGQKFKQPSGTGIDFSLLEDKQLLKEDEVDIYPLAVKAEASPTSQNGSEGNPGSGSTNAQITQAMFEKEKGEYKVRVVKQILRVNGMRYELQEIYGIGNTVDDNSADANDPGKECVICLSEPRDTTVLPCRHMCMCSSCAKVLRFQTNRCPICRQPVERLLEIKVNNGPDE